MNETNKVPATSVASVENTVIPPTPAVTERKKRVTTEKQLAA